MPVLRFGLGLICQLFVANEIFKVTPLGSSQSLCFI